MQKNIVANLFPAALAVILIFVGISLRKEASQKFEIVTTNEDRYYLPPPEWLKVFSLGYNEALADGIWATVLVYFGGKKLYYTKNKDGTVTKPEAATYTVNHLLAVTSLNPKFKEAYMYGATLTMFQHGTISRETVEMGIDLLSEGLKNFPNDGAIAFNLGFFYYSELVAFLPKKKFPTERKAAFEAGAKLIRRSSLLDGAPPFASSLAGSLLEKEGLDEMVIEHMKVMLAKETNPAIRKRLKARLNRKISAAEKESVKKINQLYEDWRGHYSFAPFDYYLLVRPEVKITPETIVSPLLTANRQLGIEDTEDEDTSDSVEIDAP